MNNRQQAREEALFVLLMEQVARQQDLQARQLGRALEEDPEAALSPALQQRCMQTLRRGFRRRDRQAAGRTTRRVMSRVAVAVLAAVLCLTAAFAVSPPYPAQQGPALGGKGVPHPHGAAAEP